MRFGIQHAYHLISNTNAFINISIFDKTMLLRDNLWGNNPKTIIKDLLNNPKLEVIQNNGPIVSNYFYTIKLEIKATTLEFNFRRIPLVGKKLSHRSINIKTNYISIFLKERTINAI